MNNTTFLKTLSILGTLQQIVLSPTGDVVKSQIDVAIEPLQENVTELASSSVALETPVYIYAWVTLVNVVIFILGLVGNIMVILVVIKVRDMRTTTNYFLVNLSVADLLVLLICQPSAMLEFYSKDRWIIGSAMCK